MTENVAEYQKRWKL